MNITLPRAVIEQALEALNYVMRHGPAVQKAKDLLQDALDRADEKPIKFDTHLIDMWKENNMT